MTFTPANARGFLLLVENFSGNVDKIVDKIVFVVYNRGRKDKYEPRIKETRRRA